MEFSQGVYESADCFPGPPEYAEDHKLCRTRWRDTDFDDQATIQNVVLGHGLGIDRDRESVFCAANTGTVYLFL